MSPVSSNSSQPPAVGGIVGWSVDSGTVERVVSEAVSQYIPAALASLMASYVPNRPEGVFAENDWNELCGQVAPAPPLPLNIEEIWEGPCPVFPGEGQKVKDTHVLTYLPTAVNNEPLTLKTLGKIAKRYFQGKETGYAYIWHKIEEQMGNQPVGRAGWFLMTKTVIDGSRGKSYKIQQNMIKELAKKTGVPYTVPPVGPAVIGMLTHYMLTRKMLTTGTRLFNDSPSTYTQCQESVDDKQLVVGNFSATGLEVDCNYYGYECLGVAALWEVSSLKPGKIKVLDKLKRSISECLKR